MKTELKNNDSESSNLSTNKSESLSNKTLLIVSIVIGAFLIIVTLVISLIISLGSLPLGSISKTFPGASTKCKYADPDLCQFIYKWQDIKSVNITSHELQETGVVFDMVVKLQGDNSQVTIKENGKENYDLITLDDINYFKDYADRKWYKYKISEGNGEPLSYISLYQFDERLNDSADKTTYKKSGEEQCGEFKCLIYEVTDNKLSNGRQFIYFDNDKYLLRKTKTEYSSKDIANATVEYSDFNIEEPSPIKEGDPFETVPVSSSIK